MRSTIATCAIAATLFAASPVGASPCGIAERSPCGIAERSSAPTFGRQYHMSSAVPTFGRQYHIVSAQSPTPEPSAAPTASPLPTPSPSPSPSASTSASTAPLIASGQIVDLERGYIVFATGDAFKLDPAVRITDDKTGAAPSYAIVPGIFGSITIDRASALVTDVRTSLDPLGEGIQIAQIPRALVSVASSPQPNPDLAPPPVTLRSQLSNAVRVTIDVEVPPETPLTDDIYMTTDSSGWNAQAIKMQRVNGRHFRIQVDLKGGTQFHYLFTRGSWQSVERARSGLARDPRTLFVPGGDSMVLDATVYRWADIQ